jgi:hypothetical protein
MGAPFRIDGTLPPGISNPRDLAFDATDVDQHVGDIVSTMDQSVLETANAEIPIGGSRRGSQIMSLTMSADGVRAMTAVSPSQRINLGS